jgi:hypothetical protein
MGYFSATRRTIRVELPSDPRYWVEVRPRLTEGEMEELNKRVYDFTTRPGSFTPELRELRLFERARIFLEYAIVRWNLDDDDGAVVPVSPEAIARMAGDDVMQVMARVQAALEAEGGEGNPTGSTPRSASTSAA